MDVLYPLVELYFQLVGGESASQCMHKFIQTLNGEFAGKLTTIMTAHSIGNSKNEGRFRSNLQLQTVVAYQLTLHQNHVFIVLSHTSRVAICIDG